MDAFDVQLEEINSSRLREFKKWLENSYKQSDGKSLGRKSVGHYYGAIKGIDVNLRTHGFLPKGSLFLIDDISELKNLKKRYFDIREYQEQNQRGNNMYSSAFDRYTEFLERGENLILDKKPLNTILYGPPGTGKTYHTIDCTLAVLENKPLSSYASAPREARVKLFQKKLKLGQVEFVTFHQSLSYEDFIEGIKPSLEGSEDPEKLQYKIEPGIFKRICARAAYAYFKDYSRQVRTKSGYDFDDLYDAYLRHIQERLQGERGEYEIKTRNNFPLLIKRINSNDSIITVAKDSKRKNEPAPKTKLAIRKIYEHYPDVSAIKQISDISEINGVSNSASGFWAIFNDLKKFEKDFAATFTRPLEEEEEPDERIIIKNFENGEFDEYIDASKTVDPYVLIIDEINRGNVSQIFGELITLIEPDKRLGCSEELKALLPYSKSSFGVPPNLYIIGTMNTADRSVEALDTAMRRRFAFQEMMPNYSIKELQKGIENLSFTKAQLLSTINKRIELLKDRDHQIGHAYFIGVKTLDDLRVAFKDKVVPLLQEYFYGDYQKIQLVLGKGFVGKENAVSVNFADNESDLEDEYQDRDRYFLIKSALLDLGVFKDALESLRVIENV